MGAHQRQAIDGSGGGAGPRRLRALALGALVAVTAAACSDLVRTTPDGSATRYGTAAALAEEAFDEGASVAVVTTGTAYPDALAAGPLAAALEAPILLTATDELPEETADALDEMDVDEVVLLGGEAAIGPEIEAGLTDDGYDVTRAAGADRYATAAGVATRAFPDGAATAVIVTGTGFADALAAAPLAASQDAPILLTGTEEVPPATLEALETLGVSEVQLVGGEAAIGLAVEWILAERYELSRFAGSDRNATAALLSRNAFPDGADTALLVTGSAFADALAAAPLAVERSAPILLSDAGSLPEPTSDALAQLGVGEVLLVGGEGAIGEDVVDALEADGYGVERIVG